MKISLSDTFTSAKIILLHYSNLINGLKEATYLKQNEQEEDFEHKLAIVNRDFSNLNKDYEGKEFVKRHFNYEFNFTLVENYLRRLNSEEEIHYLDMRKRLKELEEELGELENITKN